MHRCLHQAFVRRRQNRVTPALKSNIVGVTN